jgi:hypothetical protein
LLKSSSNFGLFARLRIVGIAIPTGLRP